MKARLIAAMLACCVFVAVAWHMRSNDELVRRRVDPVVSDEASLTLRQPWTFPADNKYHEVPGMHVERRLRAGDVRRVEASFEAISNTRYSLLEVLWVSCGEAGSVVTSQNRDDWDGIRPVTHRARMLLVAPRMTTTRCVVLAKAKDRVGKGPAPAVTLRSARLHVGPPDPGGIAWTTRQEAAGPDTPRGPTAVTLRSPAFARPSSGDVEVVADLEVTNCYNRSNACPRWFGYRGTDGVLHVETRLHVVQLGAEGEPCASWASSPRTTTIVRRVHHLKIFHDLTVAPRRECGELHARLSIRWLAGPVLTIEGHPYSQGFFRVIRKEPGR